MFSFGANGSFPHLSQDELPTPDAMMLALVEQQKLLNDKDTKIDNQQKLINVFEEKLRLIQQREFGTSSEKNLLQTDWIANEAEQLVDGELDAYDGEIEEPAPSKPTRKRRPRKGFLKTYHAYSSSFVLQTKSVTVQLKRSSLK